VTLPRHYCDLCTRQLAPLPPTFADRSGVGYADPERLRLRLPVVLGALWLLAVVGVAAGLVAAAAWAVS